MKAWSKLTALFSRKQQEREMAEEMQAHLDGLAERNVAKGMSVEEARYAARREFGGVEQIKERARDEWGWSWLEGAWRDFYFSGRSLRRSLTFSATVVLTLALCIWANTAVFSVLYGLVLKPLPFPDAGQIVGVYNSRPMEGQLQQPVSVGQYLDYKANADLFSAFSIRIGWMFNLGGESGPARYIGMRATPDYFSVLGVRPLLGRFFTEEECVPGRDNVVLLTQSFWENQYLADPGVIGRRVRLSGLPYTIVGVLPKSCEADSAAPVLVIPFVWRPGDTDPQMRMARTATMYARIKPGVDHETALAQLNTLEQRQRETLADSALSTFLYRGGHRMVMEPVRMQQTKPIKNGLLLLQAGALMVLLLGCANVASMMLARVNARQTELAMRRALGAGHGVLARQLIMEATLLALMGSGLGVALAGTSLRMVNAYTDKIILGIPPVSLDAGVLGMVLLVTVGVVLLIGGLPVLRIWREGGLQSIIQSGAHGASRARGIRIMGGGLAVAQVAVALILLIGSGLLVRSFAKVMAIDPGFDAAKIIHVRTAYNEDYTDEALLRNIQQRVLEKMREIPGVESVAYSQRMPGYGEDLPVILSIRGLSSGPDGTQPTAILLGISPEYLATMGIRLLEGRNFTEDDMRSEARPVYIVDRRFAERYFPGRSAVGQIFDFGQPGQRLGEGQLIVGVAEEARVGGLENSNTAPYIYRVAGIGRMGLSVELRTSRRFEEVMPQIRAQMRAAHPALPIYQEQTMQMRLDDAAASRRCIMGLIAAFAVMSLILAALGIYGVLAYDVTLRTKEIGIRGAIGATRWQIVSLVMQQGLGKTALGVLIGLAGAFYLSGYLSSWLYEVEALDPLIFSAVTGLLLLIALFACWLPAWRAAKVDPMVALRCE